MTLFRPEVLAARQASFAGSIHVPASRRTGLLTLCCVLLACAAITYLVVGEYSSRAPAIGQLQPSAGLMSVRSLAGGAIDRVLVEEGARVDEGQTLAVLKIDRGTADGGDTVVELATRIEQRRRSLEEGRESQRRLATEQEAGLRAQLDAARAEVRQLRAELATREKQAALSVEGRERLQQLKGKGYVSDLQLQQQEADALQLEAAVQSLQRSLHTSERSIAQLEQALRELPQQQALQQAAFERELALLQQEGIENEARGGWTIKAPRAGVVSSRLAEPGQAVQTGQALFAILPEGSALEAHLLLPSRAIGFVEVGDDVRLRFQAFPYQKFGHQRGRVQRISRSALGPAELSAVLGRGDSAEPLYRVVVALDRQYVTAYGEPEQLLPGMQVEADIVLERRRLIEWIFEPLYSLHGRLAAQE